MREACVAGGAATKKYHSEKPCKTYPTASYCIAQVATRHVSCMRATWRARFILTCARSARDKENGARKPRTNSPQKDTHYNIECKIALHWDPRHPAEGQRRARHLAKTPKETMYKRFTEPEASPPNCILMKSYTNRHVLHCSSRTNACPLHARNLARVILRV